MAPPRAVLASFLMATILVANAAKKDWSKVSDADIEKGALPGPRLCKTGSATLSTSLGRRFACVKPQRPKPTTITMTQTTRISWAPGESPCCGTTCSVRRFSRVGVRGGGGGGVSGSGVAPVWINDAFTRHVFRQAAARKSCKSPFDPSSILAIRKTPCLPWPENSPRS